MLSVRAQAGKKAFPERAPKEFIFQASHDRKRWTNLLEVKNAGFTSQKVWRTFPFENDKEFSFYRIYILENGGDPSLLTIQKNCLELIFLPLEIYILNGDLPNHYDKIYLIL